MNTIAITQRVEQTKLAMEVHQHASIARVRMTRAKLTAELEEEGASPPAVEVSFQFKSKPLPAPHGMLRIEVSFQMIGVAEAEGDGAAGKSKADPAVVVDCAFAADYELAPDFAIRPEHVKAFKDGNAIFNVWPYFREFLQSSLQRMGLPPLTAPFLRLEVKRAARKD